MIRGNVNSRYEATIPLTIIGPLGQSRISVVIDTGYNGRLTLPLAIVAALGLAPLAAFNVTLGDASKRLCDYYTAEIYWDGHQRQIRVLCLEGDPLIGTALLAGHRLAIEFTGGGPVSIEKLP